MDWILSFAETRVLGCLLEKEMTTPDYYPLTFNSLIAACNQKSNRNPVLTLDEDTVLKAIGDLRDKHLAIRVDVAGSRVAKFRHSLVHAFPLERNELAIITVLLLRGPQTIGEIRTRSERMYAFRDLEEVEITISGLIALAPDAVVADLPRQPGKKDRRYAHLLSGAADDQTDAETQMPFSHQNSAGIPVAIDATARIADLIQEVDAQRTELNQLRKDFEEFRGRFE